MNKLFDIKNILSEEGIDLEPYRNSEDERIKKWIVMIECNKNKPSRRLSYFNQIKTRHESYSKWYCTTCSHQSNSARGFKYHMDSQCHKIKCGQISKMVCPYCKENIKEGTLEDHIKKSSACKRERTKEQRKIHIKNQWARDRELYDMDVDDPDIWYPQLIEEYNRRLTAKDGFHRNDDIYYEKNKLGLLVPYTKLHNIQLEQKGEFCPIEEDSVDIVDFNVSSITFDELLQLLESGAIEPHEYRFLYNKKNQVLDENKKVDDFISKFS